MVHGFISRLPCRSGTMPVIEETLIKTFLKDLEASGIDIDTYGRREKEIHDTQLIQRDFPYYFNCKPWHQMRKPLRCTVTTWHLVGFTYGPSPDDWCFWGSDPTDVFAGDFWHMLENPWERMPGAWVEYREDGFE
jgi:hypothetical protein